MQLVAGGIVLALLLLPAPTRVSTGFVLQPGTRAFVRAETPGWVEAIKVEEGERVAARTVVAILRNPEVEVRSEILERRLLAEERALAAASAEGDAGSFREHWQRREQLRLELADVRAHVAGLVLRAPVGGIVTTPRLAERAGEFLAEGETFCEVVERDPLRARVLVPDRDVERIRVGNRVELNVRARPWRGFAGRVGSISPAAAVDLPPGLGELPGRHGISLYNYFAVELDFPNPRQVLREGMTGTAKIYGPRLPLGVQWGQAAWRWLRSKLW
jgi:multidrug efflux pump subunit AcrA (membrane-fusion protein)